MILFFIFLIVFMVFYLVGARQYGIQPLYGVFFAVVFLSLFGLEVSLTNIKFFANDEVKYLSVIKNGFPVVFDRHAWYWINWFEQSYGNSFEGLSLKIINMPLYGIFILLVWRIFDNNNKVFLAPIFLPYLSFLATKNLRDIMILAVTAAAVYGYQSPRSYWKVVLVLSIILLMFLRPFVIGLLGISWGVVKLGSLVSRGRGVVNLKRSSRANGIFVVIFLISLPFTYSLFALKADQYVSWYDYTVTGDGADLRYEEASKGKYTGNMLIDLIYSGMRYVASPIPSSIALRLLDGGTDTWGVVDDFVRFLNQVGYYLLFVLLVVNRKNIKSAWASASYYQKMFILSLALYWPVYSFYLYGITHQRLKIPFQLAVFLVYVLVISYNRGGQLKGKLRGYGRSIKG